MKNLFKFIIIFLVVCFSNSISVKAQTYDLEVTLTKMKCLKVVEAPFDTQEDIESFIAFRYYKMKNNAGTLQTFGFYNGGGTVLKKFVNSGTVYQIGLNQTITFNTFYSITGVTYTQLMSVEFGLGGYVYDKDVINVRYKECNECGPGYRLVRLVDYKSQIDAMANNTNKFLTIGSDNIMELNFFEGDANSSHIQFQFKIKVTKR